MNWIYCKLNFPNIWVRRRRRPQSSQRAEQNGCFHLCSKWIVLCLNSKHKQIINNQQLSYLDELPQVKVLVPEEKKKICCCFHFLFVVHTQTKYQPQSEFFISKELNKNSCNGWCSLKKRLPHNSSHLATHTHTCLRVMSANLMMKPFA